MSAPSAQVLSAAADAALAAMAAPDDRTGYTAALEVLAAVPAGDILPVAAALAAQHGRRDDVLVSVVVLAESGGKP